MRLRRRARLRSKLLLKDPTRKKFWRFLKNHMRGAGKISALVTEEKEMVFDQEKIEAEVLKHFKTRFSASSSPLDKQKINDNEQVTKAMDEINQMLGEKQQDSNPKRDDAQTSSICSLHTNSK